MMHVNKYKADAFRNKNKALANLQDIQQMLSIRKTNFKRVGVLIDRLIESKFYIVSTKNTISSWSPKQRAIIQHETIAI